MFREKINKRLPRASAPCFCLRVEGSFTFTFTWRTRAMRISCACTFVTRAHSHMRVSDWFIIARRLPRASAPSLLPSGRGNFYFFFYTSHTRVDAFAYVPLCARVHNHSHMRASWHARVPHAATRHAAFDCVVGCRRQHCCHGLRCFSWLTPTVLVVLHGVGTRRCLWHRHARRLADEKARRKSPQKEPAEKP